MNQAIEQYLRCYVNFLQDDWSSLLGTAEFAFNSTWHSSTGFTPFEASTGYNPKTITFKIPEKFKKSKTAAEVIRANQSLQEMVKENLRLTQATVDLNRD